MEYANNVRSKHLDIRATQKPGGGKMFRGLKIQTSRNKVTDTRALNKPGTRLDGYSPRSLSVILASIQGF